MVAVRTSGKPWIEWAERRLGRSLTTHNEGPKHLLGKDEYPDVIPLPTGARIHGWSEDAVRRHVIVHCDLDRIAVVYVEDLWRAEVQTNLWKAEVQRAKRVDIGRRDSVLIALRGQSVVYFVQGAGLTKIGTSTSLNTRLGDLRVGSPVPLTVAWMTPGGQSDEVALHVKYAAQRNHGEWFSLSDDDMRDIIETYPLPPGFTLSEGEFVFECSCGIVYRQGGLAARRCHETHEDAA